MFKRIKKFNDSYSNVFFTISLVIIIGFLVYFSIQNRNRPRECVMPTKVLKNFSNYVYKVKYETDDLTKLIYIKKYDKKYLIEVNTNDDKESYYVNYFDLLKKNSDGIYTRYRDNYIIDGLDNKMLLIDYLNDISYESKRTTINERTCYVSVKSNLTMCINLDNSIEIEKDDYKLTYTITEYGNVEDFNVIYDLDVYE